MHKPSKELIEFATPIINKIAKHRQNKHTFAYFDSKDIYQEIWLLCLDALKRYKPESGELEHFLNRHVSHRIKNLKRDRYFRPEKNPNLAQRTANRINIVNAIPIGDSDISNTIKPLFFSSHVYNPLEYCESEELLQYLTTNLPEELIDNFKLLIQGHKIKEKILVRIRENVILLIEKFNGK